MAKKQQDTEFSVLQVSQGRCDVAIVGREPLVLNRMSEKAKHDLLLPKPKMNAAAKATTLKHRPIDEFRAAAHVLPEGAPTLLGFPAAGFRKAMATASLDLPGTKKAQLNRLMYVTGKMVPIYGLPELYMAIVRMADMNRTPDVRTRVIIPRWAALVPVTYVQPLLNPQAILRLMLAAGISVGVGDGRVEKGAMTFGLFEVVDPDNAEFAEILQSSGREAQQLAMETPVAHDDETAELLSWYDTELQRRKIKGAAA